METYFINNHHRQRVTVLFPMLPLQVQIEQSGTTALQKYFIVVEKLNTENVIQIRLTEETDHSRMYISTIDNTGYERIRADQCLHVTYQGFVDHLITILENCKRDELHLALLKDKNGRKLHIFEKSSFKNLTHLWLEMEEATTETVLFHINQSLRTLQERITSYATQINIYQNEISGKNEDINKLKFEIRSFSEKLFEKENLIFSRNTEEINRLQQTIKSLSEKRELDEHRYKSVISRMQEKIDQITKESNERTERMVYDAKRIEAAREENAKLRSYNTELRDENERIKMDMSTQQNRDLRSEATIAELKRQVTDLRSKISNAEKRRSEYEAELEAEKAICQTKKHALKLTTDDLDNAKALINNLNKENIELKSKIERLTGIAMTQEKILQDKNKKMHDIDNAMVAIQQEHMRNRVINEEYALTVKRIKDATDLMEEKYRRKINEMILKCAYIENAKTISSSDLKMKQTE